MPIYRSDDVRFVVQMAGAKAAFTPGVFRGFDHARMFADLAAPGTGLRTVTSDGRPRPARRSASSTSTVTRLSLSPAGSRTS